MLDSVEPGRESGRECQIRIGVRSRRAALDAQRLSMADDAKAGSPIVVAPRDSGGRERSGDVALVRSGIGRVEREQLAQVLHPAAEAPAEAGGAVDGTDMLLDVEQ